MKEHQKKSKKAGDSSIPENDKTTNVVSEKSEYGVTSPLETDCASVRSQPNATPDVETSSIASSRGSCNNVSAFFSTDPVATNVTEPQHFFDQIPPASNLNGFSSSNGSSLAATIPEHEFNRTSAPVQDANSQSMSEVVANYHQYFNLYNDAVRFFL